MRTHPIGVTMHVRITVDHRSPVPWTVTSDRDPITGILRAMITIHPGVSAGNRAQLVHDSLSELMHLI